MMVMMACCFDGSLMMKQMMLVVEVEDDDGISLKAFFGREPKTVYLYRKREKKTLR